MDTIYLALVFSACQILVVACTLVAVKYWYHMEKERIRRELEDLVHYLITSPDEKTPSPLAVLIDQGALLVASRLVQQLKAMLAGTESALSKAEGAARQLELLESAPPWVSMLAGILPPRLRSQLMKNPQMVGALGAMLSGRNKGESSPGGNHHEQSIQDRIRHSH